MPFIKGLILIFFATTYFSVNAQSIQLTYCIKESCFPSLPQAEAAMRASEPIYGKYLRRANATPSIGNFESSVQISYEVPNQPAEKMLNPYYGTGLDPESCPHSNSVKLGEIESETCKSEALVVQAAMSAMSEKTGCNYFDVNLEGSYYIYNSIGNKNGIIKGGSNAGALNFAGDREISYKYQCPNWSTPQSASFPILKYQVYYCPQGFVAIEDGGKNLTPPIPLHF